MRNVVGITLALLVGAQSVALGAPLQWNGPMSWDQVIARTQSGSFEAQLATLDAAAALSQAAQARAALFPQIGLSGTAMNSTLVQFGMPSAQQTYGSLSATVPLLVPQTWASASAARADANAAQAMASARIGDAVLSALQSYDKASLASAIVEDRAASLRDQLAHLTVTQERVRAGKSARYVAFRDRAGVAAAQEMVADAQAQRDEALNNLALSLDLIVPSHISVTLPRPQPLAVDEATLRARAFAQRPELLAAQGALAAERNRLSAARAAYLPSVSLSAQTYSGTSNPPLGHSGSQVGVTASLALIDGGMRSAQIRQAEIAFTRAQVLYDRIRLMVETDLANALREYDSAQAQLTAATAGLQDAQAQLQIAQLRERAGKAIELETLDALATQASARENLSRAIARYDDAVAAVHHATGDYSFALSKGS
jgi:outer membrane protein TolC